MRLAAMHPPIRRLRVRRLRVPVLIALAGALVVAGCSKKDNSPVQPIFIDEPFADEIAQHVASTVASDAGGSMLSLTSTAATVPHSAPQRAGGRVRPARIARDTTFTAGGVAWTVVDTFYAGGVAQDDYTPACDSMHVRALGTGDLSLATFHALYRHLARLRATGLAPAQDTVAFAGVARDSTRSWFTAQFSGATRRLLCVSDVDYGDVRVVKGQSPTDAPVFGIAVWSMNAMRLDNTDTTRVERQRDVFVLIAYDGSGTATMQVDGLYEYTFDLKTGVLTKTPVAAVAARGPARFRPEVRP
jgi:hypothetical protein